MRIFNKSLAVAACVAAVGDGTSGYAGVLSIQMPFPWADQTEGTTHLDWMSIHLHCILVGVGGTNRTCHRGRNFESSSDLQLSSGS